RALRSAASRSRLATLSGVSSYRAAACGAPRRFSDTAFTTTTFSSQPWRISSTQPGSISRLLLQRAPLQCTLPPSMACLARLRVLKKRAAHSHLSSRTFAPAGVAPSSLLRIVPSGHDFVEVDDAREAVRRDWCQPGVGLQHLQQMSHTLG